MKKGLFTGWQSIFAFTFKQDTKGKFRKSTAIVAVIMLIIGMAISVVMAAVQKKSSETISPIEQVHVINSSDLLILSYEQFEMMSGEAFPNTTFVEEDKDAETLAKALRDSEKDVILKIENASKGYKMTLILPENSTISEGEGNDLLGAFGSVMETGKLLSSGIPMEKLVLAMSGVSVTTLDAGENEKSIGEEMVAMLLPMVVCMFLYILVLIYGMSMGNAVSVEKTSKLMEMMLTMTRPYAMIFGKILALTTAAVVQLLVWVAALVGGFFIGDAVSKSSIYPEYTNYLMEAFKLLQEQAKGSAFSTGAFVLFVIESCIAILFFCLLAATFGSFATKTEEVPQCMGYYQICVVLGFLGSYMVPLQEKPMLTTLCRIFPLSSAFMVPGDILVGNITLLQGGIYMVILAVTTVLLVLVAGKVYMNQLFYRGESVISRLQKKLKKSR